MTRLAALGLLAVLPSIGGTSPVVALAPQPASPAVVAADDLLDSQPALETPWFTFYSRFGFNLYDAVLTSATARRGERPDPFIDSHCFESRPLEERSAWNAAVGYYAETVAATGDFSRERTIVRAHLTGVAIPMDDDDRRDLDLALLFLRTAARAWHACAWEEQDAANRTWIKRLVPRLERDADAVGARLEQLFDARWRRRPIAVDVVETAGWAGADTQVFEGATHIQIGSDRYQGPAAFEIVFHEASHELVSPRNGPIARLIAAASSETGVPVHPSLWHAILFVTTGEVVRATLAAAGEENYQPFADTVFRGDWQPLHQPLIDHWLPFVRGERDRDEAARAVLLAIGDTTATTPPAAP